MAVATPSGNQHRWLVVPEQVNRATTIAFVRVFIGVFWLFEVTVGHNWKLGGFGSGTNPGWVGPGAGDSIREEIGIAVEDGTWHWVAWLYQNAIEPNAAAFSYLVIALQVALGVFFIFGFLVRPMAVLAITFDLSIFFLGNSRIPPFFSIAHLFLLFTGAGMYFGADGWLWLRFRDAKTSTARALRWLIDVPLFKHPWTHPVLLGGTTLMSLYFFMQMAMRSTGRMNLVSMELAFLFGLVAAGLYFGRIAADRLAVAVALIRVFVGFKFLHEIWVRVEPGVNGLPGWASTDQLKAVFETISDNHWAPFAWIVDTAFLPAMSVWVIVFGVAQLAIGVALVLGVRTRLAAMVGLTYLAGLGVLGFTRYAPFVYGLLIAVLALDGGRALSFDSQRSLTHPARYGLPIPRRAVPILAVVAAINFAAAAVAVVSSGGIAPDGYTESMGQMTTAMVAIFSGLFALMGWFDLRTGGPEPTAGSDVHSGREWIKEVASV
jgi:hypothetical protein